MREARIGRALHAGTGAVPDAVQVTAKKRAASLHALPDAGLVGIVARIGTLGIHPGRSRVIIRVVPILTPLPHVSRHVIQSVAIGRITRRRRGAAKTILLRVFAWKSSLPD